MRSRTATGPSPTPVVGSSRGRTPPAPAEVRASASVWCYASPGERAWWGGMWADRIVTSSITHQAVDAGHADDAELRDIADAWRSWAADDDGWFAIIHGEILCRA